MPTFDISDSVRLSASFVVDDTLTDPTTVTLAVLDPSENTDTYTYALAQIVKDAVGLYHKDVVVDEVGLWKYRWSGTGACQASEESYFDVRPAGF